MVNDRSHIDIGMDREIVSQVMLFICDNDKLQDDLAKHVQVHTDGVVDKNKFIDWLQSFDVENIK